MASKLSLGRSRLSKSVTITCPRPPSFANFRRQMSACTGGQRDKAMARVRARLEKLQRRVAKGRLKAAEKIGAAAGRILTRNHGHRYYDWTYQDGVFRFFEHPLHFTREQA